MTETSTFTELDQQTKDELQPPCSSRNPGRIPCQNAAEWATWLLCDVHGRRLALHCSMHLDAARLGLHRCRPCLDATGSTVLLVVLSAEPLR